MPGGKVDEDLEDDPFEGVELGDDAPEPTQEEMDEWATLDTPDEDFSPKDGPKSASSDGKPAPSAPQPKVQSETEEKDVNVASTEVPMLGDNSAAAASEQLPAEPPNEDSLQQEVKPTAAELPSTSLPQPQEAAHVPSTVELSEITPSFSPPIVAHSSKPSPDEGEASDQDDRQFEEDDVHQQQRQRPQQAGAGWGAGWGTGWGLGALGGKLREVAAGAVRDVKDLTETFQAALADVTGAEDEEEEAGRLSAMDRAAEGNTGNDISNEEAAQTSGSALPTAAPLQATEPGRASAGGVTKPAGRGQEGGSGDAPPSPPAPEPPSPPADPVLEAGLQAIDAQVEQLASGAARAFSSLWGGLSSVAKVVAAEVAASVADVGGSEAVRGVAQIGTKIAHTAERGLETVGRTAMVLLEEVAGVGGPGGQAGRRRIWGEEADARAADMGRDPASFQDFFYIYGGEQLAEEVNHLSNECAHLCNKSRSKLEADQQQALDAALARLGPYFNDPAVLRASLSTTATSTGAEEQDPASTAAAGAAAVMVPELAEDSHEAAERLLAMYDPIGYLCQDSQARAEAFLQQIREAVAAAAAKGASGPRKTDSQGDGDSEEKEGEQQALLAPQDDEEGAASLSHAQEEEESQVPAVSELLAAFRGHFTKRMAEVTTAQLQLMLNLGASLAAPARTGRPAVDGISWPESSEQQAALLAVEARRMVADLQTVASAYLATVAALRALQQGSSGAEEAGRASSGDAAAASKGGVDLDQAALGEMESALRSYGESASASIKAGYKGLLYAVLLRSLVTQIAQQEEVEEKDNVIEEGQEASTAQ